MTRCHGWCGATAGGRRKHRCATAPSCPVCHINGTCQQRAQIGICREMQSRVSLFHICDVFQDYLCSARATLCRTLNSFGACAPWLSPLRSKMQPKQRTLRRHDNIESHAIYFFMPRWSGHVKLTFIAQVIPGHSWGNERSGTGALQLHAA